MKTALQPQFRFRAVVAGQPGVGKTRLLRTFCPENFSGGRECNFNFNNITVVGDDQSSVAVKLGLWEAIQETYSTADVNYYRHADIILLAYDVTQRLSFYRLKDWDEEAIRYSYPPERLCRVVIGLKIDREKERVCREAALEWAMEQSMMYFEYSSKEQDRSVDMFQEIARNILAKRLREQSLGVDISMNFPLLPDNSGRSAKICTLS